MFDYINIGPAPAEEDCAQVGDDDDYYVKAKIECRKFIELIRKELGPEPEGAKLVVKSFPHDFGNYCEVVCRYDVENEKAVEYAFKCEADAPTTWE